MRPVPSTRLARRFVRGGRGALFLAVVVAGGIALRVAVARPGAAYHSDTFHYLLLGEALAEGRGYVSGGSEHPDLSRPPLLPVAIASGVKAGLAPEAATRWIVLLATALLPVPLWVLGRRLFGPDAAVAGALLGGFSCVHGLSQFLLPDGPTLTIALGAVAAAAAAMRRPGIARFALAGILAGVAALGRAEAFVWIPAIAILAALPLGRSRARGPGAVSRGAAVLAGAVVVGAPFVLWATAELGRPCLSPGAMYVAGMREVSERYGLRWISESGPSWTERAAFTPTRDLDGFLAERYFKTGVVPPARAGGEAHRERLDYPPGQKASMRSLLLRRARIVARNLARLPGVARDEHLLPVAPIVLGLIGAAVAATRRSGRRALAIASTCLLVSLAPFASHVEQRFAYAPFAFGLVVAAAGWGALVPWLARRSYPAALAHLAILAAVAVAAVRHDPRGEALASRRALQLEVASESAGLLGPGPLLASRPMIPYWAGRPFRPLPIASAEDVIAYARLQGAAGIVLEGERERQRRPEIAHWLDGPLPPELRVVVERDDPEGGALRVLALAPLPGASR